MSGLIDRDLAIMNVKDIHFRSNFREYSVLDEVMTMLYQMQDAEPEITNEQAIEHLQSTGWMQKHDRILTESTWDIIRCRDCRWGKEVCGNIECFADTNVPPEYHGYDWFCPNGERRTDGKTD